MPRKPTRHRQSLRHQPVTFSPFARSLALLSANKFKHRAENNKLHEKCSTSSSDHSVGNHTFEDKNDQSDLSDSDCEGVVQADFAFFDPKPNDFHGVKVLLQNYLDNKLWDLSGFVDLILDQTTVGTVVKIENDEDENVYAIITALNIGRYKDKTCMMELIDFLLKACQEKDVLPNLRSLLIEQAQVIGLLVSQQVVNLPPQLLPHLYGALFDEVTWATEDEVR